MPVGLNRKVALAGRQQFGAGRQIEAVEMPLIAETREANAAEAVGRARISGSNNSYRFNWNCAKLARTHERDTHMTRNMTKLNLLGVAILLADGHWEAALLVLALLIIFPLRTAR